MERNDDEALEQLPLSDSDEESNTLAELIGEEEAKLIPPDARGAITRRLVATITAVRIPGVNPMFQRITSEHIASLIAHRESSSKREHTAQTSIRRYQFLRFIIAIIAITVFVVLFRDDNDMVRTLVIAVTSFLGGLGWARFTR